RRRPGPAPGPAAVPPRRGTRPGPPPAPAAPGSQDHATRSWQLPQQGLAEPHLEEEQSERRPEQPGIALTIVEKLRRLEGHLLRLVDLFVDLAQARRVRGPEGLPASGLGGLLER